MMVEVIRCSYFTFSILYSLANQHISTLFTAIPLPCIHPVFAHSCICSGVSGLFWCIGKTTVWVYYFNSIILNSPVSGAAIAASCQCKDQSGNNYCLFHNVEFVLRLIYLLESVVVAGLLIAEVSVNTWVESTAEVSLFCVWSVSLGWVVASLLQAKANTAIPNNHNFFILLVYLVQYKFCAMLMYEELDIRNLELRREYFYNVGIN